MLIRITLLVLSLVFWSENTKGDGTFSVLFQHYDNPSGEAANGHCCDGKYFICQLHGCDYLFTICLGDGSHAGNVAECSYGSKKPNRVKDHANVDFEDKVGNLTNPLSFSFQGPIPAFVVLKIDVYDKDTPNTDNDFVDFLSATIPLQPGNPEDARDFLALGSREEKRTSLNGQLSVQCASDWYGDDCGTYCENTHNTYYCDPNTGDKICYHGWTGFDCSTPHNPTTRPTRGTHRPTHRTTTQRTTTTTDAPDPGVVFVNRANADCDNLAKNGYRYQDGVYQLRVASFDPFMAYCDMSAEGWTVIQRRQDGSENFYRSWDQYVAGFGEIGALTEYWLGLEKIYWLTNQRPYKLRITIQIGNGEFRYAEYEHFYIDNEDNNFSLHVSGYSGNAGNALEFPGFAGMRNHNGQPFSTFDRDHDNWEDDNCAEVYSSGWWFNDCYWSNLNGVYIPQTNGWPFCDAGRCISWRTVENYEDFALLKTEMEILPNPELVVNNVNQHG